MVRDTLHLMERRGLKLTERLYVKTSEKHNLECSRSGAHIHVASSMRVERIDRKSAFQNERMDRSRRERLGARTTRRSPCPTQVEKFLCCLENYIGVGLIGVSAAWK